MEPDMQKRCTVEKIGGTSIANTRAVMDNVLVGDRTGDDLYNRIFVVSAYAGITDKLLKNKGSGAPGVFSLFAGSESEWSWGDAITRVGDDMQAINARIFTDAADLRLADNFVRERIEGVRSCLIDLHRLCSYGHFRLDEHLHTVREMLAALGEAHSAHNTALLLKHHGINAVFADLTGWRDESQPDLDHRILSELTDLDLTKELPIVTGYAHCQDGMAASYGRGYTEVTFSRIAVLLGAKEAIIHKEFHLSSADPKLAGQDRVRAIGQTNYDVADQLSNLGMEAVHPRAAKGLRQADIPLRIKNTFDPDDEGTLICGDYTSDQPCVEIVTGIKGVYAFEFFEQDMVGVKGYDAAILASLQRNGVRIVTKSSNANTITHFLAGPPKAVKQVVAELEEEFPSAEIGTRKVAIVSAIGSDLNVDGLAVNALKGLDEAGIDVLGLHKLMRNVDIMFVIEEQDFDMAVRCLHAVLIEGEPFHAAAEGAVNKAA